MITISDVAERAGVTREALCKWKYQSTPNLASFEACLNAIGYELVIRKRRDPDVD